jgi:hypothetical protein
VSIQSAIPPDPLARRALLFTPGQRLGWVFRGRSELASSFPVPPPDLEAMQQAAAGRADTTQARYLRARRYLGLPALIAAAAVLAAALLQATVRLHLNMNGHRLTAGGGWIAILACVLGIAVTWQARRHSRHAAPRHAESSWAAYLKARAYVGVPSVIALVAIVIAGAAQATARNRAAPWAAIVLAIILVVAGIVLTAWLRAQARRAAAPAMLADGGYQQALAAWQQQARDWEQNQAGQHDDEPRWVSAGLPDGCLRADVFGGRLAGWQALLTTHGTSLLAAQPLLVLDLTSEIACQELAQTAAAAGVPSASWLLPSQIAAAGMLSTLTPAQLATALAEAIHADSASSAANRADRALDARVLEQLTEALGGDVTPARLAAAARAALGQTAGPAKPLSAAEQAHIAAQLFPAAYRRQIEPALARLEAFLTDLARHASPADSEPASAVQSAPAGQPGLADRRPAYLTCLALEPSARTARTETLAALAIQWLTVQITASHEPAPAVIIAGADEITRGHLERLADACERRGVPLTLLFRHLREAGLAMLGGGATAFMRLGNHAEAEQAASYIGRQHTFVLSQLTATQGGSRTTTSTISQAQATSDTISVGWQTGWNTTSTGLLAGESSHGRSTGETRSAARSVSRTWSDALAWAQGTNWTAAGTSQRVYEYTVEPTILQHLPDQALLLVTSTPQGPALQAIECDPAIITLPGAAAIPDRGQSVSPGITTDTGQPTGWPHQSWQSGRQPAQPPQPPNGPPFRWPRNPGSGQ